MKVSMNIFLFFIGSDKEFGCHLLDVRFDFVAFDGNKIIVIVVHDLSPTF